MTPMLRFTIRDVLWLTVVVAMGVGWTLERQRGNGLERRVGIIENDAQQSRIVIKSLYDDLDRIERALPPHGLTVEWSKDFRPSLQGLPPTATGPTAPALP